MARTCVDQPADHTTSVYSGEHTGDPVPIVIGGPDVPASRVTKLSEAAAARGNLGRIRGLDLMPILTDVIGRSRLYGSEQIDRKKKQLPIAHRKANRNCESNASTRPPLFL